MDIKELVEQRLFEKSLDDKLTDLEGLFQGNKLRQGDEDTAADIFDVVNDKGAEKLSKKQLKSIDDILKRHRR